MYLRPWLAASMRLDIALFHLVPFSAHRKPSHPHSFPTRRSSDLPSRGGVSDHQRCSWPGWSSGCVLREWRRRRDRKSTRLNSSHVEISYAVFCLKEKSWDEYRELK